MCSNRFRGLLMKRRTALTALTTAALPGLNAFQSNPDRAHTAWVGQPFQRRQAVKPGMTRAVLLTVFREEGGISTGLRQTYVSQECPYFHVDVEFEAVGRPTRDSDGRVTLVKDDRDI